MFLKYGFALITLPVFLHFKNISGKVLMAAV